MKRVKGTMVVEINNYDTNDQKYDRFDVEIDQKSITKFDSGEFTDEEVILPKAINSIQSGIFPHSGYQILINEDLRKKIENMHNSDKKRLHRVITDMQWGYWELGIHVKKLVGVNYPVFEARLDRNRRILFLIKSIPLKDQAKLSPALIIEDIVRHKYISRGAKKIAKVVTERINLQNYNIGLIGKIEHTHKLRSVEELECLDDFPSLAEIFEEKMIQDIDDSENMTGLPNGIKYFRFDPDVRDMWLTDGVIKQFLALSPYQQKIVYQRGPVLINGGAGTGKTTVLAHIFLYYSEQKNFQFFYITLTRSLKKFIKQIIQSMSLVSGSFDEQIITFDDICKKIIRSDEMYFIEKNHIDVFNFLNWFKEFNEYHNYDGLQIWQEYYGIIKGNFQSYEIGIMELKEYLQVSSKVSLFSVEDRVKIYPLVRKYHIIRRDDKKWDSIDLAQFTLDKVKKMDAKQRKTNIRGIICDEVQDFVGVQYSLFNELISSKYRYNLFFGGDSLQTINSSNFRWADMKSHLYNYFNYETEKKGMKDVIEMTRNFRSTTKLIDISNSFLKFKRQLGILDHKDILQKGVEEQDVQHFPGLLLDLNVSQDEVLEEMRDNKKSIIIVYSDNIRVSIEKDDESSFIMTIPEVKGLEFPSIFLFNLASDTTIDWRKVLSQPKNKIYFEKNYLHLKYVFNRLYVAITRARRKIIIFERDKNAHLLWSNLLSHSFISGSIEMLKTYWNKPSSKEEYLEEAEYLFMNERYAIAADYYKSGGDLNSYDKSMAYNFRHKNIPEKSAYYFMKIDDTRAAALEYEHFNIDRARKLYHSLGDEIGEKRCDAKILVNKEKYVKAAKLYESIGEYIDAIELYQRVDNIISVNRCHAKKHEKYNEWEKALNYWLKTGNTKKAKWAKLKLFEEREEYEQAAEIAESIDKWDIAAQLWKKIGNTNKHTYCIAKILEGLGELEEADATYEKIQSWDDRIAMWINNKNYIRAADILVKRSVQSGNKLYYIDASENYNMAGEINKALETIILSNEDRRISELHAQHQHWEIAAIYAEKVFQWQKAGKYWLNIDRIDKAEIAFEKGALKDDLVKIKIKLGKLDEAAEIYQKMSRWKDASNLWVELKKWKNAAICYRNLDQWNSSSDCWVKHANTLDKVDDLEIYQKMYLNAAIDLAKNISGTNQERSKINEKIGNYYQYASSWFNSGKSFSKALLFNKAGNSFAKAGKSKLSAKNYQKYAKNLSNTNKVEEKKLAWKNAAEQWIKIDLFDEAIYAYSQCDMYDEAVELSIKYDLWDKAAEYSELQKKFTIAAGYWLKCEKTERAAKAYDLAFQWSKSIPLWKKMKKNKEIAIAYENLGQKSEAAVYYGEASEFMKAGDIYTSIKDYEKALLFYTKGDYKRKQAGIFEIQKDYLRAAELYKKVDDNSSAARNYELAGEIEAAASQYQVVENYTKALKLWRIIGKWDNIGYCARKLNKLDIAIDAYEKSMNYQALADIYIIKGDDESAIIWLTKTESWDKIAKLLDKSKNYKDALIYYKKVDNFVKIAKLSEKLGMDGQALEYYKKSGNIDKQIQYLKKLKNWGDLVELLEKNKRRYDLYELLPTITENLDFDYVYKTMKNANPSKFTSFIFKYPEQSFNYLLKDENYLHLYFLHNIDLHEEVYKLCDEKLQSIFNKEAEKIMRRQALQSEIVGAKSKRNRNRIKPKNRGKKGKRKNKKKHK